MLSIVWSPSAVTLTMPPPDVPVNDISLISSWAFAISACIFWACFSMAFMLPPPMPPGNPPRLDIVISPSSGRLPAP